MATIETGFSGGSALTVGDSTGGSLLGDVARLQLVRVVVGDSEAVLEGARAAMARVEREIDHLWRDSMNAHDREMSQLLADVSHSLQRAAHRLEHRDAIG
jgi:hypothetical protein